MIQGDADTDLVDAPDDAFDYVILSRPAGDALSASRAGAHAAHRPARHRLVPEFRPLADALVLDVRWPDAAHRELPETGYDTLQIHFCTIKRFPPLVSHMDRRHDRAAVAVNAQGKPLRLTAPWCFQSVRRAGGFFAQPQEELTFISAIVDKRTQDSLRCLGPIRLTSPGDGGYRGDGDHPARLNSRYDPMTGIQWAANYLRRKAFSVRLRWRLRNSARVIIIVGAMGNIGRRLMQAFPNAVGIDRMRGADLVCDLRNIDYDTAEIRRLFESADALIHLATSSNVDDPEAVHWRGVVETARLVEACARYNIRRVVLPVVRLGRAEGWMAPQLWRLWAQQARDRGAGGDVFDDTGAARRCAPYRMGCPRPVRNRNGRGMAPRKPLGRRPPDRRNQGGAQRLETSIRAGYRRQRIGSREIGGAILAGAGASKRRRIAPLASGPPRDSAIGTSNSDSRRTVHGRLPDILAMSPETWQHRHYRNSIAGVQIAEVTRRRAVSVPSATIAATIPAAILNLIERPDVSVAQHQRLRERRRRCGNGEWNGCGHNGRGQYLGWHSHVCLRNSFKFRGRGPRNSPALDLTIADALRSTFC